eukprot:TRINITY_DN903_c1_g2_i1.p1 TRINITY_DN903_c1_g2~~TRINITY_DN903_c1_g2_i1.p1  ORF type:complete len:409 (+),score=88.86 TRINITY_DN903_c1_g2_i1:226-1452(+)
MSSEQSVHEIKHTIINGKRCGIALQDKNGPCALLAVFNCMCMKGQIIVREATKTITTTQIIGAIADRVVEMNNKSTTDGVEAKAFALEESLNTIPKLDKGMDVNMGFQNPTQFEYTPEMNFIDILGLKLVHGWIPSDEIANLIENRRYNQLITKQSDGSLHPRILQFLRESPSQLTLAGIVSLHELMAEGNVAILFRNNHFSTITKIGEQIYILITDKGFPQQDIVFESLTTDDGDLEFWDGNCNVPVSIKLERDRERRMESAKQNVSVAPNSQNSNVNGTITTLPHSSKNNQYQPMVSFTEPITHSVPVAEVVAEHSTINTNVAPATVATTIPRNSSDNGTYVAIPVAKTVGSSNVNGYPHQEQYDLMMAEQIQREEMEAMQYEYADDARRGKKNKKKGKHKDCVIQ